MKKLRQLWQAKGQSLVEMTLTLPFLILMFVGLFEVGYALRNYLVVVNANREGTRFAARGRWIEADVDPTVENAAVVFDRVIASAGTDIVEGEEVPFLRPVPVGDQDANASILLHYFVVPPQVDSGCVDDPADVEYYGPFWFGAPRASKINPETIKNREQIDNAAYNRRYFCGDGLTDPEAVTLSMPSPNNFVIIEVWYDHEQLLGLPIFTELLPETITLYSQGRMRVTLDSARQSGAGP